MREQQNNKRDRTTIGLDRGDQWHRFCVLRISRRGDIYLQRLLVSSAQYIPGPLAPPSALRQYGLALAAGATPRAKMEAMQPTVPMHVYEVIWVHFGVRAIGIRDAPRPST